MQVDNNGISIQNIPEDVIKAHVFSLMDLDTLLICEQVNTQWKLMVNETWEQLAGKEGVQPFKARLIKFFPKLNTIPIELVTVLGGKKEVFKLPELTLSSDTFNDHIDYVKPSEMQAPIMRGVDSIGRPFIAFKLDVFQGEEKVQTRVECIFKRYVHANGWMSGGPDSETTLVKIGKIGDEDYPYIAKFLQGEELLDRSHMNYTVGGVFKGHTIKLAQ